MEKVSGYAPDLGFAYEGRGGTHFGRGMDAPESDGVPDISSHAADAVQVLFTSDRWRHTPLSRPDHPCRSNPFTALGNAFHLFQMEHAVSSTEREVRASISPSPPVGPFPYL